MSEMERSVERRLAILRDARFEILLILAIAIATRFIWLDVRLMDHDESVHAWISYYDVLKDHTYIYNPAFHGPFLYFVTSVLFHFLGDSDFVCRITPAAFSILGVIVAYLFRRWIGNAAYLLTFFMLFSPSILYYSRYMRNDLIVLSSFLTALYFYLRYREDGKIGFALIASFFLAIIFTSKENWVEYLPCLLLFIPLYGFYSEGRAYLRNVKSNLPAIILSSIIFLLFASFLYSSAFVYIFGGDKTPLEALANPAWVEHYLNTSISYWVSAAISFSGQEKPHFHPVWFYSVILLKYEFLAVSFAIASLPVLKARISSRRLSFLEAFSAWWAFVALVFYHIMSYKTPWLVVHISAPLMFFGCVYAGREIKNREAIIATLFLCAATLVASLHVNYVNFYDAAGEELIYVQTQPQAADLVKEIEKLLAENKSVAVYAKDNQYWPLPWMLKGKNVIFYGDRCPVGYDYIFTTVKECEKEGYRILRGYDLRVGYTFWEMVREEK